MRKVTYKKICSWCGKEFTAQKSSTRYCGKLCATHAYKKKLRDETRAIVDHQTGMIREEESSSNTPDIMTPKVAAEYLGVHVATIYRYMESGIIKGTRLPGKTLIKKNDIDKFFDESEGYVRKAKRQADEITDFTTMKEVAQRYDLSPAGAYKILKENKVPSTTLRGKTYYSLKHVERVFRQREAAMHPEITEWYTCEDIKRKYGMTDSAVYSFAYDFNIPKKTVKRISYYSKKHVDIAKGLPSMSDEVWYTVEECMTKYDMTRDQVYHHLKYAKIQRIKVGKIVKFRREDFDKLFTLKMP